jgi:glycosyltransferase involved in cell wall biosynthesis
MASIANIDRYQTGFLRMWRWAMEHWYPWSESRMARYSPVVVDNDPLAAKLRQQGADVRMIVASLVRPHHLASRPPQVSIQPQPLRICWTGRMVRLKGLHVMLDALSELHAAGIEFQVDFIGHGDESYIRELKTRAARPDLGGKVRFLGPVPWGNGLFEHLDRAEVFVLPSFTEGTPKTVTEAMARGLVVVASRVGGLARVVEDGTTGFLVSPGNPQELAERLRTIALDPDLRLRMAAATLKKVSRLTMDEQLPILVTALKDAAAGHECPAHDTVSCVATGAKGPGGS